MVRYLAPAFAEGLLCGGVGEEGFLVGVEVVRAQYVQVDHGAQPELVTPVERIFQQTESLGIGVEFLVEHLLLVDGDTDVVESHIGDGLHVVVCEVVATGVAASVAL